MITIGLDETLFYQLALLLIIIFLAKKLYLNPVTSVIFARDRKIAALMAEAEEQKLRLEESQKKYEDKLAKVKVEISSYQASLHEKTASEVDELISKVKSEVSSSLTENRAALNKEVADIRGSLQSEVSRIATLMCEAVKK